jgi:iron complex transport system substrate-binding protein
LRVVSLLPSATEIVCAIGAGGELVGVSHECDHPAEVAELPVLTCSRLPAGGLMGTWTGRCALLRAALAIYHLDVELDPGLVVTVTIQATPHRGPPVTAPSQQSK